MKKDLHDPFDFTRWGVAIVWWASALVAVVLLHRAFGSCSHVVGAEVVQLDLRLVNAPSDVKPDLAILWTAPGCQYCDRQLKVCSQLSRVEGYMILVANTVEHGPAAKQWEIKTFPTIQVMAGDKQFHRAIGYLDLENARGFLQDSGMRPDLAKVQQVYASLESRGVKPQVIYGQGSFPERVGQLQLQEYAGAGQTQPVQSQVAGISGDQQRQFNLRWSQYYGGQGLQGWGGGGGGYGQVPQWSQGSMGGGRSCPSGGCLPRRGGGG